MVKAGMGITLIARWAAAPYLESGALKAVRLTRAGLHRTWSAVMIRQKTQPGYLTDFVKILASRPTSETEIVRA